MFPGFDPMQWILDRIHEFQNGLNGPLAPLEGMFSSTNLAFTTTNPAVQMGWQVMVAAADGFLGLFVLIGVIQIMYGNTTGSIRMPIGQFIAKVIVTAILIHLSGLIGQQLLLINNALCGLATTNLQDFIRKENGGQLFNQTQTLVFNAILFLVFGITLFRVIFQAIKRIIRFNLLYVLSGPAFLTSIHPSTAPVFSSWIRLYIVTIFEQFVQYLCFSLGAQFVIDTNQTGVTGFILAVAMLNMVAEIPKLLERFGAAAGGPAGGLDALVGTAVKAAVLFA